MTKPALDDIMWGMGFTAAQKGPNVTKLRSIMAKQIENGLKFHSAGTWALEHGPAGMKLSPEERAAAFIEVQEAIDAGQYTELDFADSYRKSAHAAQGEEMSSVTHGKCPACNSYQSLVWHHVHIEEVSGADVVGVFDGMNAECRRCKFEIASLGTVSTKDYAAAQGE